MKRKKEIRNIYITGLVLCLFILSFCAHGQGDVHSSQFYETSILRNPALTGVFTDNYRVMACGRSQWNSIDEYGRDWEQQ